MSHNLNPYESPKVTEPPPPSPGEGDEPLPVFRPAYRWGSLAVLGLLGSVLLGISGLVVSSQMLRLYTGADSFDAVPGEWEAYWLNLLNIVFGLLFVLRLVTAGFLLTWMYRAHVNLAALGHRELDSKPVWAVVCWFVPVMNLLCPYQVMHEIWWRSDPQSDAYGGGRPSATLVQAWWGAWLTLLFVTAWGNYLDRRIETVQQAAMALRADVVHFAVMIFAALLLVWIINTVNRRQIQRYLAMTAHET